MSKLYIIATPIGNLQDITLRALTILQEASGIIAEDRRVALRLLNHFHIKKTLYLWHQHSGDKEYEQIKSALLQGDLALVTDAGTPGVSDPGGQLVQRVIQDLPEIKIVPIPGVSALTAIISVAGIPLDKFVFLGFLPHKKGRQTLFEEIKSSDQVVIFFESVHRIDKTLEQLADCPKTLIVGRELTKQFETIYRGTARQILSELKASGQIKGEFVVVVNKR